MKHLLPALTTLALLIAGPALAQDRNTTTATAAANTPVYIAPDTTRTPLRVAAQGTVFTVVGEEGEWTKVQFKDPQWGVRVGYVATSSLRFSRPELQPMDLSMTPGTAAPPAPERPAPAAPRPWERSSASAWPAGYIVGRGGVTFGTRTAPVVGAEFGGQVAPMLQIYGSLDWHRDISPSFVDDVSEFISDATGLDVNYRFPTYVAMGGAKVTAPSGAVRPYALGGFGYGRVKGTVEVEGDDVTDLLDDLGYLDKDEVQFNKVLFEVGGGISFSNGTLYGDVSYRFRKFLDTGEPINVSGIYAGVGVGF
jgi:hypothetical protein